MAWEWVGYEMDGETKQALIYRKRARQLRLDAQDMKDLLNRRTLLSIADDYEKLAQRIEDSIRTTDQ
jgi:hypothetical protein